MREIHFIWAEDLDGWIGKDNSMPWHVSEDLKHFKQLTTGHPVVMGRHTYNSMGKPLPNRQNIVLTHQAIANDDVIVVHDVETLDQLVDALPDNQVFIIGGAHIYQLLLGMATHLNRTVINGHFAGDVKMPPIDYDQWHLQDRTAVKDADGQVKCWFEDWTLNK